MELRVQNLVAHAPTACKWLMVLGMAYTLASAVSLMATPAKVAPAHLQQPGTTSETGPRPAADPASIARANLFGKANANAGQKAAAAAAAALVDTRLPLVLHGVFVADDPAESTAILANKGRSEALFHIGDRVPGNATLEAVNLDHVLLRRGRTLERLLFPKSDQPLATPNNPTRQAGATTPETPDLPAGNGNSGLRAQATPAVRPTPRQAANKYRDMLKNNPGQALEELDVALVSGEAASGYRIGHGTQSPYLRQAGLQPGDVILSVNGRPVGDVGSDRLEMDNILAQGSARMEIQRGERRFFITASLN